MSDDTESNPAYDCPSCGVVMTFEGHFGSPQFRRYRCHNSNCRDAEASWPEDNLRRLLDCARAQGMSRSSKDAD